MNNRPFLNNKIDHFFQNYISVIGVLIFLGSSFSSHAQYDYLIKNGRILDGTGNPWYKATIAIKNDRIAAIGDLKAATATQIIDAADNYISPGFIDPHSHAAGGLIAEDRSPAQPLLAQGVTTVIINPDGRSPMDLLQQKQDLLKYGVGINAIPLIGHGSVRQAVLGMEDRLATSAEMEEMKTLVRQAMKDGAYGISTGPFYSPGSFSNTTELIELSKVVAEYGGVYTSHIRDESNYTVGLVAAVDEVIEISKQAKLPAVVTHIKALGPPVWGYSEAVIQRIERARTAGIEVYADQYPYIASATGLGAALLPRWAQAGGRDSLLTRFNNPEILTQLKQDMEKNLARRGGAARIQFRYFTPDSSVEGKNLAEIATKWAVSPIDAAIEMLKKSNVGIVSFNMQEKDVHNFMQQPWTMTCSDGSFPKWGKGVPHPRAFGTFPRKIKQYVIEKGVIDLPTAIRSMTSLPAQVFKIKDRGVIRVGAIADLAIFDLSKIKDKATFTEPYQLAEGMEFVFVNGKVAIFQGKPANKLNGQVLLK